LLLPVLRVFRSSILRFRLLVGVLYMGIQWGPPALGFVRYIDQTADDGFRSIIERIDDTTLEFIIKLIRNLNSLHIFTSRSVLFIKTYKKSATRPNTAEKRAAGVYAEALRQKSVLKGKISHLG